MDKLCTECGRASLRLRKQRCDACYMRMYRNGEVPAGALCCGCGERRRSVLTHVVVGADDAVACGNCALTLARTRPRIETKDELEKIVARERRRLWEKRADGRRIADRSRPAPQFDVSVD